MGQMSLRKAFSDQQSAVSIIIFILVLKSFFASINFPGTAAVGRPDMVKRCQVVAGLPCFFYGLSCVMSSRVPWGWDSLTTIDHSDIRGLVTA